jgi:hypothetical protein
MQDRNKSGFSHGLFVYAAIPPFPHLSSSKAATFYAKDCWQRLRFHGWKRAMPRGDLREVIPIEADKLIKDEKRGLFFISLRIPRICVESDASPHKS